VPDAPSGGMPARLRTVLLGAIPIVVLLVVTQFLLPGKVGGGRGTPAAILFIGLIYGLLIAMSSVGVVLVYRTLRVVNFAQTAMGVLAIVFVNLAVQFTRMPFLAAFAVGIVLSAVMGLLTGIFTLRFFNSSRLFLTVVTIVGAQVFVQLITWVLRWPIFPPINKRPLAAPTPEEFKRLLPFPGFHFGVGSFPLKFGFTEVFGLEVAILTLAAIGVFFRYTRAGVAVRGMAENPERASLLGIGVAKLSVIVWTITGALAGVTAILIGLVSGATGGTTPQEAFNVLLPIFAAAVIGRMTKLPTTIYAAVLIGIAQRAWDFSYSNNSELFNVWLFGALAIALVVQRRYIGRSEAGTGLSWSGTDEPRPIPKELSGITSIRLTRLVLISVAIVALVAFPFIAPTGRTVLAGVIFVNAIAVLSLVVLTGWAGQVSLGQFAFVAVGAVVGGALTSRAGIPFWFALPLGAAITGALAFVVGLPALRVRGLFLLATTFAFAVMVQSVLFNESVFGWLLPKQIDRPTLFFVDFDDERSMYFLCLAALGLALVLVANLRRSRTGRMLIAVRENEANVQSFGVSATRAKLTAFAISGAMCGFAGVLFAHQQRGVSQDSFQAYQSVQTFVQAVFGGVSSGGGALLGSAYFTLVNNFLGNNQILTAFFSSGGPLLIIFLAPGGLISLVNQARDSMLRIVAQRRQIVVPSLFADYDADALERRLIPLSETSTTSGLAALPADERFAMASELYAGRGERIIEKLGPKKEAADTAALTAAARSVAELEEPREPAEVTA
jgi:branched-chain amino acid transport system permease protein